MVRRICVTGKGLKEGVIEGGQIFGQRRCIWPFDREWWGEGLDLVAIGATFRFRRTVFFGHLTNQPSGRPKDGEGDSGRSGGYGWRWGGGGGCAEGRVKTNTLEDICPERNCFQTTFGFCEIKNMFSATHYNPGRPG